MLLYVIRHGDPIYETDTLTERGNMQAEALGLRLQRSKIDRIFSSPMRRARETAAPACRLLGLECEIEEWAHEIEDERKTIYKTDVPRSISWYSSAEFRAHGDLCLDYDHAFDAKVIESTQMRRKVAEIERAGDIFLEKLGYKREGENYRILFPNEQKVALVCHTCLSRAWLSTLLHIPLHIVWAGFQMTHTGVTIFDFPNDASGVTAPRCLCYSDMSHLYAEHLDLRHDNKKEL